jgi:hypothetical protein
MRTHVRSCTPLCPCTQLIRELRLVGLHRVMLHAIGRAGPMCVLLHMRHQTASTLSSSNQAPIWACCRATWAGYNILSTLWFLPCAPAQTPCAGGLLPRHGLCCWRAADVCARGASFQVGAPFSARMKGSLSPRSHLVDYVVVRTRCNAAEPLDSALPTSTTGSAPSLRVHLAHLWPAGCSSG